MEQHVHRTFIDFQRTEEKLNENNMEWIYERCWMSVKFTYTVNSVWGYIIFTNTKHYDNGVPTSCYSDLKLLFMD